MSRQSEFARLAGSFAGKRVLITGHTGFKGGWLALWLARLGAQVVGVALPPNDERDFFNGVRLDDLVDHRIADIRKPEEFNAAVADVDAELVVHMAAQALVRRSYEAPLDTYLTNVVGSAAVLDAARSMRSLKAAIVVTSDKCYENREWVWGYRENDPMGGDDPYSSSKGCAELVVNAYRRSFFSTPGGALLASVRAGNVFGGGDWAADRIIPDLMKAAFAGVPARIRNPSSIRPWQHVFEPLWGYLLLAARLLDGEAAFADAWNFGPDADRAVSVAVLARLAQQAWGGGEPELILGETSTGPHEAAVLRLDSTKARAKLGWKPLLSLEEAVAMTVEWYKASAAGEDLRALSEAQIDRFVALVDNRIGEAAAASPPSPTGA